MEKKDLFPPLCITGQEEGFALQAELAHQIGEKRFGSECKHEKTKNGCCLTCLRKVVDRLPGRG